MIIYLRNTKELDDNNKPLETHFKLVGRTISSRVSPHLHIVDSSRHGVTIARWYYFANVFPGSRPVLKLSFLRSTVPSHTDDDLQDFTDLTANLAFAKAKWDAIAIQGCARKGWRTSVW